MDILGTSLQLSDDHRFLNVTTKVVDLSNPTGTTAAIAGTTNLQYVTRWQFGNTIYYAAMENTAANRPSFYAGKAQSIDLCSVSACFPHVLTYPEPHFGGNAESGTINCPAPPSPSKDRKSTRLNSSHVAISYAFFCLKKKIDNTVDTFLKTQTTPVTKHHSD